MGPDFANLLFTIEQSDLTISYASRCTGLIEFGLDGKDVVL